MALDLADIYSLSDFQRNARKHIRKLKVSGKPAVLTVKGQAQVVIQSARAYQKLLDDRELLESIRGISRGLEQTRRGEGRPMREFLQALAKELGMRPPLPAGMGKFRSDRADISQNYRGLLKRAAR